jgi:hypothetical protein
MEGVAGISRPRRRLFPGGGRKPAPASYLPAEYAPLRWKGLRAVKFPQASPPPFSFNPMAKVALREYADRAMVKESRSI